MTRHCKTLVATPLVFVLLYYGVAWAVLGCFYIDDRAVQTAALAPAEIQAFYTDQPAAHHTAAILDCLEIDFHTESLGGSTDSLRNLQRLVSGVFLVRDAAVLNMLAVERPVRWSWLKAVFDRFAVLPSRNYKPRYLALSVLRF